MNFSSRICWYFVHAREASWCRCPALNVFGRAVSNSQCDADSWTKTWIQLNHNFSPTCNEHPMGRRTLVKWNQWSTADCEQSPVNHIALVGQSITELGAETMGFSPPGSTPYWHLMAMKIPIFTTSTFSRYLIYFIHPVVSWPWSCCPNVYILEAIFLRPGTGSAEQILLFLVGRAAVSKPAIDHDRLCLAKAVYLEGLWVLQPPMLDTNTKKYLFPEPVE